MGQKANTTAVTIGRVMCRTARADILDELFGVGLMFVRVNKNDLTLDSGLWRGRQMMVERCRPSYEARDTARTQGEYDSATLQSRIIDLEASI